MIENKDAGLYGDGSGFKLAQSPKNGAFPSLSEYKDQSEESGDMGEQYGEGEEEINHLISSDSEDAEQNQPALATKNPLTMALGASLNDGSDAPMSGMMTNDKLYLESNLFNYTQSNHKRSKVDFEQELASDKDNELYQCDSDLKKGTQEMTAQVIQEYMQMPLYDNKKIPEGDSSFYEEE